METRSWRNSFKKIDEVINVENEFWLLRETANNYRVVEEFSKIFPELTVIVKAVKVEKKVLFLKTENSVWKSELNFQKNALMEKINNYFNQPIIKHIKFL
ncbi:MAG: DUF721 domain-containing protein [Melioribacteraceae bacterium]|jgi:hypothetical protein|nr:DUF721 domain-containing protein [Melioribacteraceae bacterium]RJP64047.1 MAG: DUF721 domain-containing protein [Ignavibacteriales bacterium]